jgi:hypothetical protein
MLLKSASSPTAVFCPPQPPGGLGQPACSAGESANEQSAIARIKKPQRKRERLIDFFRCSVVIFFVFRFLGFKFLHCSAARLMCEAACYEPRRRMSGKVPGDSVYTEKKFANYFLHL